MESLLIYNQYNKIHQLLNMIQKEKTTFFQLKMTKNSEMAVFGFESSNESQTINYYIYLKRFLEMFFMILEEKRH
jgi:hypothetical protein